MRGDADVDARAEDPLPAELSARQLAAEMLARNRWNEAIRWRPHCRCFAIEGNFWFSMKGDVAEYRRRRRNAGDLKFHAEPQDTACAAWQRVLELIEEAAEKGSEEFAPLQEMDIEDRRKIITLPPTIAKLKAVKRLKLYGSYLVRIPPEIGDMSSLEDFDPYRSYRLHWFPYEITRCTNLRFSSVSTRALYGNFKLRPPFPRLNADTFVGDFPPGPKAPAREPRCSVCARLLGGSAPYRVWISLWVATDVLPLLVNACSEECIGHLPAPAEGYVSQAHRGGLGIEQPDCRFVETRPADSTQ